jgi:LmbE family N-acetylglucosaminyl deacetylase
VITPITSEAVLSDCFGHLLPWTPSREKMVVIAPHPDDEVLGAGGLIAAQAFLGVEIVVVAVTDGEILESPLF